MDRTPHDPLEIPRRLHRGRPPPKPGEGNLRWWLRSQLSRPWPLVDAYGSTDLVLAEGALRDARDVVERIRMTLESGLILDDLPPLDEQTRSIRIWGVSPTDVAETLDAQYPAWREVVVRVRVPSDGDDL
jgi:hypothetical protein